MIASLDQTEATYRISITYQQKVQAICNLLGLEEKSQLDGVIYIAVLKDHLARHDGDGVNVSVNASTLLVM